LLRSKNVKFYPEQHVFTYKDEIYEFTLEFGGLIPPVKYIDVVEMADDRQFYVQGIILDPDLNTEITRGFKAYQLGDVEGALQHFINFAEMDLYFEYGLAYFNILYILSQRNRWDEAKEWYDRFKDKFFYDKQLHINELQRMGIMQRIEEGR
jgi:tetratricopeptide (TPR) repeat protein